MSVNMTELSSASGGVTGASSIVKAMREISKHESTSHLEAAVTATDISARLQLSEEEEASLVARLREAAKVEDNAAVAQADEFWLLAAIRARKGDVTRALSLLDNYFEWRSCMGLDTLTVATSPLIRAQLEDGVMFVSGICDRDGRPVISLRLRNLDQSKYSAADTTRTISFVLEWTLRTFPAAQKCGVVIVNDMSHIGFRNLDIRLPNVIQKAFSKTIPVRLAAINAVNPPFFVKAIFSVVSGVLSRKMKARFRIFGKHDKKKFQQWFAPDHILKELDLGGTVEWSDSHQRAWIEQMTKDCVAWPPATTERKRVTKKLS